MKHIYGPISMMVVTLVFQGCSERDVATPGSDSAKSATVILVEVPGYSADMMDQLVAEPLIACFESLPFMARIEAESSAERTTLRLYTFEAWQTVETKGQIFSRLVGPVFGPATELVAKTIIVDSIESLRHSNDWESEKEELNFELRRDQVNAHGLSISHVWPVACALAALDISIKERLELFKAVRLQRVYDEESVPLLDLVEVRVVSFKPMVTRLWQP